MPKNNIPNHLAIICDGNRRWARNHGLEVVKGHEKAIDDVFEPLIDRAIEHGISFLTFWIFSTENWKRDKYEVDFLMNLFRRFFDENTQKLHKKGVRVNTIGDLSAFPDDIQQKIQQVVEETKNNSTMTVTMAMNYGGRDELVRAVQKMIAAGIQPEEVSAEKIADFVDTANLPDPDLIIRTSGQLRTSGFLLWQSEYAEYMFPQCPFPEFTPEKLDTALEEFERRQRRFGS